jgi:oligopeptide/dipeptide ABC transporter ATP-binding protein
MINVRKLEISFEQNGVYKKFIRDLTFNVSEGQILGVVGESGCGKSITNFALMGLLPANAKVTADNINVFGTDLQALGNKEWNQFRGNTAAIIFQDPMTALNPCLTIEQQLLEVLRKKNPSIKKSEARNQAAGLLEQVGIAMPLLRLKAYPHELSGGMAQRTMIAMALACNPKLLIADEPTTALDVVVQKQILDLLLELRDCHGMTIILVSHDIGVIKKYSDIMLVMYSGEIVESGRTQDVMKNPRHPYTQGLLRSLPGGAGNLAKIHLQTIPGNMIPINQETDGCRFHTRCSEASAQCSSAPPLKTLHSDSTWMLRCHL